MLYCKRALQVIPAILIYSDGDLIERPFCSVFNMPLLLPNNELSPSAARTAGYNFQPSAYSSKVNLIGEDGKE